MKKLFLTAVAFFGLSGSAFAVCTSPAVMHDFPGTSFNMSLATNAGDGNCISNIGIIGTLPAYAATPTFNLGTISTAATAANQTSQITQETAIAGATGTTTDAPTAAPATGSAATVVSLLKGILNTQGSGGGGGGATTIADGADVTEGAVADAATTVGGAGTVSSKLRLVTTLLSQINTSVQASIPAGTANIGKVDINTMPVGTGVDGWDLTQGATSDAASVAGGTGSVSAKLRLMTTTLNNINTNIQSSIAAGSAIIGKVGIDQTTSGTTNGVAIVGVNGSTALAGNGATGAGSQRVTIASDNAAQPAAGQGAAGSAVPAGATLAGLRAQSSEAAAVANGQMVGQAADLVGKTITLPYANPENGLTGQITTAMTATTSTAVTGMGAQGSGVRNYITACTFSNSHATVGTMMLLQDGSGGSTLWQTPAASAFGGAHVVFPSPIKTTANTALFAANVTTGANTFVSCTGYKGI